MNTPLLIGVGLALGMLPLAAGLLLGLWIRRSESSAGHRARRDLQLAHELNLRLQRLTSEMAKDVGTHRLQLDKVSHDLEHADYESEEELADVLASIVGEVVKSNHDLQAKLDQAETNLQKQAAEIEAHATRSLTDALTGLPNRRALEDTLESRHKNWQRRSMPYSVVLLDVDHFKDVNDRYGHVVGDRVLCLVAEALRASLRGGDFIARYGGEEFAVVVPTLQIDQIRRLAERLHSAVAGAHTEAGGDSLSVTISGGLAAVQAGDTTSELIRRADEALYAAKAAGRARTYYHEGERCRPLTEILSEAPSAHHPKQEISPELADVCDQLRQCLEDLAPRDDRPADREPRPSGRRAGED